MKILKKLLIIIPVICGIVLFVWMKSTKQPPTRLDNKERVQTVRVIPLEKTQVVPRAIGYGYVEADRTWEAISEVSGKIVYMNKNLKKGYFIPKGELLLKIDTTTYGLAETRGMAELMTVDARLKELAQSQKNTRRVLSIEKKSLSSASKELKRKRELFDKGYISASDLQKEERIFLTHQTTVNNLQNTLALIPSQKKALLAQKKSGESTVTEQRLDVAKTQIYAPFNCRLSAVNIELHQYATAGSVLVKAQSIDRAEIAIQVAPKNFLGLMPKKEGSMALELPDMETIRQAIGISARVRLSLDEVNQIEWDGRFSRTSESIDLKTGAITVYITVDKPYENILLGKRPPLITNMYVEVELRGKPVPDRFVIPRSAVHGGKIYICTSENQLKIKSVEIEFHYEDMAVLSTGLEPGQTLVLTDLVPAVEGMLLKPVQAGDIAKQLKRQATGEDL
jgi:multidrug efflux pump subunit AcrA (membrane-fusion protein)